MFDTPFFASPSVLLQGALVGLVFGFLLQKAHVTRYHVIVSQFLLRDFTVLKVMLTAIIVGGVGIYGMLALGMLGPEDLHIKSAHLVTNLLGGAIFGLGMAVLGYCPGTAVGAIGDGSRDAIFGLLGMIVGAGVYAEADGWIVANLEKVGDYGKATLADTAGLSPWWFMLALAIIAAALFVGIERWERGRSAPDSGPA